MQGMVLGRLVKKKAFFSTSRTFESLNSFQITKAPPLLDLDLPDCWTSNPTDMTNHHLPLLRNGASDQIAAVIDGKSIADEIRSGIAGEVRRMKHSIGNVPGLAVILVGQRKDSRTYVRNKIKACGEVGITSLLEELSDDCGEDEVLNAVLNFNDNPSVHGILVQLPLPQARSLHPNLVPSHSAGVPPITLAALQCRAVVPLHMDEEKILNAVSLEKDVDGFHPLNIGKLAMRGREPLFIPCTPKGWIELLVRSGVEIMGKKAVVIGRSNIVGLPIALLLQRHHATVTLLHAFTKNPEEITREADIVVSAVGVANLVRGSWLKPGAVVIDVGTNPVEDCNSEHGYRLVGDVCYDEAVKVVSAMTPVPGGVGPMTIAMLLGNTLDSAKRTYRFA